MGSYFEVAVGDERGTTRYQKGGQENLGHPLGFQEAESLAEDDRYVIITFSGGARLRIPHRHVVHILEG